MAKKDGARIPEQNQIRSLAKQGLTADEISDQLRIRISTVRSFIEFDPLAKPKEDKLTTDEKIAIQELADDNTSQEIADTLELDLSDVEAFLESEE